MSMPVVAIYDGHCVICNTTRRVVRLLDWFRRVEFLDLHQHTLVMQRYPHINHEAAMGQIHVIADNGKVYAGFNGTRRMLRALPLALPLWALLHLPIIGNWLGPKIYQFIARNRYAINRLMGVDLAQTSQDCEDGVCKMPDFSASTSPKRSSVLQEHKPQ
jgi:predicted DCC family thiol-disulfide oxidoreductase YuxK